jgi:hypothetical protein
MYIIIIFLYLNLYVPYNDHFFVQSPKETLEPGFLRQAVPIVNKIK